MASPSDGESGFFLTSLSALLLSRRLRRAHLDATGQGALGEFVKIDHRLGDIFPGQLPGLWRLLAGRRTEFSRHAARHDGADPDAIIAHVLPHRLAETIETELRGVVGAPARERIDPRQTRNVEDVTSASLAHERDCLPAAIKDRRQ